MDDPEDDPDFEASVDNTYEIDVHLLNGTCRENYSISLDRSVREEKERIWNSEGQGALLELNVNDVVLVLEGTDGERRLMEDDRLVEYYLHDLAVSSVRFVRRGDIVMQ